MRPLSGYLTQSGQFSNHIHINNKTRLKYIHAHMQTHKYTYTHVYTHIICVYVTVVSEKGAIREVEKELDEGKRKWKHVIML